MINNKTFDFHCVVFVKILNFHDNVPGVIQLNQTLLVENTQSKRVFFPL